MNEYTEEDIERDLAEAGKTDLRITPEDIDAQITGHRYHVFEGTTVTVCCLILRNGYCVVGHSAAASRGNFDREIGRKLAYQHARNKIWPLEGYRLREYIHHGQEEARNLQAREV